MLRVENVCKTFHAGTAAERRALCGLDLLMAEGEFLVVIGGNGSGKSTLLNAVAGVFPVDSGRIELGGEDITNLPEHRRAHAIGRVFQDPMRGTAASMRIEENLALAARRGQKRGLRAGITDRERKGFRDALSQLELGLEDRLDARVGLLSGGQRQAVTLLMATLAKPRLLLLDEHTAALDPRTAKTVLRLSDKLVRSHGLTTMMVTHNMTDALQYGDRLVLVDEGRIAYDVRGAQKAALDVADLLKRFAA